MTSTHGFSIIAAAALAAAVAVPASAEAQCADFIVPGAVLHWTYHNNSATRRNRGTFTVTLVDGPYVEIMGRADSDPAAGVIGPTPFQAAMAGSTFVAFNSQRQYHEVWIGTCGNGAITGRVHDLPFVITR